MKYPILLILLLAFTSCDFSEDVDPEDEIDVENIFNFPRTPRTQLSPGQEFTMEVPEGKKVLITDIYIENTGGGFSQMAILEQSGENTFEVRYAFNTEDNQTTIINYTTGIMLGDEGPIAGSIKLQNISGSQAGILPRINGVFID